MNTIKKIGIVGATGIVGQEIIKLFEKDDNINEYQIKLYASEKSKGKKILLNDNNLFVDTTENIINDNLDYIFLVSSSTISKEITQKLSNSNIIFIDNSSAFRLEKDVSLIVPEINLSDYILKKNNNKSLIISNPNCCTVILCMLLYPLSKLSKLKQIDVCTYQSASGSGIEGLNELLLQNLEYGENQKSNNKEINLTKNYWNKQYIFNVFPHNTSINESNLMNDEENKIILETQKILNDDDLLINPTCIRVPTLRSHCEAVTVYFEQEHYKNEIEEIINRSPGIKLVEYCDTLTSSEKNDVYVSRIRPNPICLKNKDINDKFNSWNFFISGDQLLKGAALNAFQIFKNIE